jgi:hypothetical protein
MVRRNIISRSAVLFIILKAMYVLRSWPAGNIMTMKVSFDSFSPFIPFFLTRSRPSASPESSFSGTINVQDDSSIRSPSSEREYHRHEKAVTATEVSDGEEYTDQERRRGSIDKGHRGLEQQETG